MLLQACEKHYPLFHQYKLHSKLSYMQKQKTIYHLIVDKSGSMGDCIEQTISGFNEQVSKIQQLGVKWPTIKNDEWHLNINLDLQKNEKGYMHF